jgi:uncharacterized protein YbjT (DUF2867 family)
MKSRNLYVITGITGKIVGVLARTLLAANQPVRAVVRDADKGAVWAAQGCELALAEMHDEADITVKGQDGEFAAYTARPTVLPAPAVVVVQELFGVNADIRKTCDELAAQGFIAIAPDLYWRQEPGVDLDVTSEADWQHGLRVLGV